MGTVTVSWQTIITAAAVLAAAGTILKSYNKGYDFVKRQQEQDKELKAIREETAKQVAAIQEEQALLTYGILACLKGLKEQGCNGPVTEAVEKIEKHINQKAHGG